jgi:CRP-like cAMP-binding protein
MLPSVRWAPATVSEFRLPGIQNLLIERLPRADRMHFLNLCVEVELAMSAVVCESGSLTQHAYFPREGYISLVTPLNGKPVLEVGMVGKEGMLGTQLVLGVTEAPLFALVQGPGTAWRVTAAKFRKELLHSEALRASLLRYVQVTMNQSAASAACLRFHHIGPRLARWLLMTQDRAGSDTFHVTQEFLAYMLGVRRVGITAAATELQRLGSIQYRRGEVTVLDRRRLENAACSCYAADKKSYVDVMH